MWISWESEAGLCGSVICKEDPGGRGPFNKFLHGLRGLQFTFEVTETGRMYEIR